MEDLVSQVFAAMATVPTPLIYVIASVWVGLESAGIGLPLEVMLLFAGSLAGTGRISLALVILCTTAGCLVFSSLAYFIGLRVGTATITRVGRYIGLTQERADHMEVWLRHRGGIAVILARLTPVVRTFGSFVMGAADIPFSTFTAGTFAGAAVYCGIWIMVGNILGESYRAPLHYLDKLGWWGVAVVVAVALAAVVLHHFWGRHSLRRLAAHFHRHKARMALPITPS